MKTTMESSASDNEAKTRRYYDELWNVRNLAVIPDWIAPDFVGYYSSQPEPVRGVEGFRRAVNEILGGVPDLEVTVLDTIARGDRVVSRVEMRGTHRGVLMGYAPTGLALEVSLIGIERYADGLCVEEWVQSDDLALARQIKALPGPGSRAERVGMALHGLSARRLRRRSGA